MRLFLVLKPVSLQPYVYNETDGKTYNISGISCKRPAYILPELSANVGSSTLFECACNLINGGYNCNTIWGTYRILSRHLSGNSCYPRYYMPNDALSRYKQTKNSILSQTIGRFLMNACADITTIHINQNILDRDRCLKLIQSEDRTTSHEMNMVLSVANLFYRKQVTKETATYNEWNKHANDICQVYNKRLLPNAKNQNDLKKIRLCAAKLKAMKITSIIAEKLTNKAVLKWLKAEPRLQKGGPIRIIKKSVQDSLKLFWRNEQLPSTAMGPGFISKVLYEPTGFLSDVMQEGVARIRDAFTPFFTNSFRDDTLSGQRAYSTSENFALKFSLNTLFLRIIVSSPSKQVILTAVLSF